MPTQTQKITKNLRWVGIGLIAFSIIALIIGICTGQSATTPLGIIGCIALFTGAVSLLALATVQTYYAAPPTEEETPEDTLKPTP